MFVIFILRRECHLYNEEVESPCEDRKNLAIGSVHKGMCRGWEWGGFFTYELSAWSRSSVSYPACSLLPVASSRFVTSGLGERQRDTAAECEHENGMCDPDGPISFADVLEQGHLTKPFVSRAAIVWWIVASCPSLTRVKQNTRTRFMWLFNVLFPLIHLAFSAPFTPPIPNTSHLSIWEGMSFSDRFWSMQIVLECVCVCARAVGERPCFCDWRHFWVDFSATSETKKQKTWLLFQWPYSSCVVFFSLTFILKIYLSLEKRINLQRSICSILNMEYFRFLLHCT